MYVLLVLVAVCIAGSVTVADTCEPLTIPMCKDIGYTMAMFPNVLGHTKQDDASLEIHQFFPLLKMKCSPRLQELLCAFYAPKCDPEDPDSPVFLPSRQLCEEVQKGCESSLLKYGLSWPIDIPCDQLAGDGDNTESSPEESDSSEEETPTKFQLVIKYSPRAIIFSSCCQVYSYSLKTFSLPSDADAKVRSADVRTTSVPKVTWKGTPIGSKRKGYATLLMVTGYTEENDSNETEPRIYTNWMVTNIRNGDISNGITIKEYEGPQPTSSTDNRVYFLLYKHSKPMKLSLFGKYNNPEHSRNEMDLDSFISDNKLMLAASKYMIVDVDEYSRYRSVLESSKSESEICSNVEGYPKVCRRSSKSIVQTVARK